MNLYPDIIKRMINYMLIFISLLLQTGTGKTLAFLLPALIHIDGQITYVVFKFSW